MIFGIPTLSEADHLVLDLIDQQQRQLGHQVGHAPLRWSGLLRRNAFARAIQGSNSIEGINATVDEAAAVIDDDRPDSLAEEPPTICGSFASRCASGSCRPIPMT